MLCLSSWSVDAKAVWGSRAPRFGNLTRLCIPCSRRAIHSTARGQRAVSLMRANVVATLQTKRLLLRTVVLQTAE